jgi:hypothetical protein
MRITRYFAAALTLCSLPLFASVTQAQQMMASPSQAPRINYVMPMGAQAGSTVELRVSGQDLKDVEGLHFNFPGVKAEPIGKATENPSEKKKGKQPAAITVHTFKVTLPANAPLGTQDVRIVTKAGISNPRAFVVSDHKDINETEPNDDVPKAQRFEINTTINGVIGAPTDVDYFVFAGKKGQRVVCAAMTTTIDSRLPVEIQVYSAQDRYLANNRGYADNDAVLDVTLPEDGDYFVRVFSFSYTQGGPDYFYRLRVSTAPWIDAIFPPVVEPGKTSQVTIYGRNLPGGKLDPDAVVNGSTLEKVVVPIKTPNDALSLQRLNQTGFVPSNASMLDGFDHRMKNQAGASNSYLLTYAGAPVVLDQGDNDDQAKAQKITVPCVIGGRLEKKADRDWYLFSAKKGEVFHLEAFAERIGAPMDLYFQLRDAKGSVIVEQDDNLEVLSPQFFTRTDDPQKYRFAAPADGMYQLMVTSREAFTLYGPRFLYTVNITRETPDFRLVAMATSLQTPDANIVPQSGAAAFNVYVWRFGGFSGDIIISGNKLPAGLAMKPQVIAGTQKQAAIVVHAEAGAKPWAGPIHLIGTSTVNGNKLLREVRSASVAWPVTQANTPTMTRLDRELVVAVREKAPFALAPSSDNLTIKQGDKITIPVKLTRNDGFKSNVTVVALGGPPGLNALPLTLNPDQSSGNATLDPKGNTPTAPGNYTFFLRGSTLPINPKQPAPKGAGPNIVQYSLPVRVTIVPKQLGKVTATPTNAKVSVGKTVEVTAKIARQFDLPIALKVEAVFPANVKGLSAKASTINSNEDETKILITAAPDAMIAANTSITLRFTAMFNDTVPIVHETKLTLAVTK